MLFFLHTDGSCGCAELLSEIGENSPPMDESETCAMPEKIGDFILN